MVSCGWGGGGGRGGGGGGGGGSYFLSFLVSSDNIAFYTCIYYTVSWGCMDYVDIYDLISFMDSVDFCYLVYDFFGILVLDFRDLGMDMGMGMGLFDFLDIGLFNYIDLYDFMDFFGIVTVIITVGTFVIVVYLYYSTVVFYFT